MKYSFHANKLLFHLRIRKRRCTVVDNAAVILLGLNDGAIKIGDGNIWDPNK